MLIANLDTVAGPRIAAVADGYAIDLNRAVELSLRYTTTSAVGIRTEADAAMPATLEAWLALVAYKRMAKAEAALATGLGLVRERGTEWGIARQLAYPVVTAPFGPPVGQQATVYAIGLNFRDHAEEAHLAVPEYPVIFTKPPGTLGAPDSSVRIPPASFRIDYEGEVAIVIGRRCRNVNEAEALEYVAGYTLANDVSARDWQFRTSEMMIGKAFDGFCPMGPHLVLASDVPDPSTLTFETHHNGEVRQNGKLTEQIFGVAKVVSYLSEVVTLQPGDAILTGTPAGIGATRASGKWLKPGDTITVTSPQLGTLTTRFI